MNLHFLYFNIRLLVYCILNQSLEEQAFIYLKIRLEIRPLYASPVAVHVEQGMYFPSAIMSKGGV